MALPGSVSARKTIGSSVLLWFRTDLPRAAVQAHWRGPHAQLVARSPTFRDYRQHHFAAAGDGLWPAIPGVQTNIPTERRVDGMPEVIMKGLMAALKPNKQAPLIFADEANAFARTIAYICGPGAGRWYQLAGRGDVGTRCVVLLRRRPDVKSGVFKKFVQNTLGPALAKNELLREVNTQVFMRWKRSQWDTPGVGHDNPPADQFHASLVLGFADEASQAEFLRSTTIADLAGAVAVHCGAVHAYQVEITCIYVKDGRVTLPQIEPVPKPRLDPVRRALPPPPARAAQQASATPFPTARLIPLSGNGAEDVVEDAKSRLICGLAGGRIVRIDPASGHEETIGHTGGRPLGLEVLSDGRVLICDAHRGLLRLSPDTGEIETLVWGIGGIPLRFCSNVTAAVDGTYWFTESTSRFDFEHFTGAMLEHRPSGRLFRRDPDGHVEVVLDKLHFANGLTLIDDDAALIFAETDGYRLSRLELRGTKAGRCTVIVENLPGAPDNLSRYRDGKFWVAMAGRRSAALDRAGTLPGWLRQWVWRSIAPPDSARDGTVWAMAFDPDGNVVSDLQTQREDFYATTGVVESAGKLYLASVERDALLQVDLR